MKPELLDLCKTWASFHRWNYEKLQDMRKDINECADLEELADFGYGLKRIVELLEDTRKEMNRLSEVAQKLQCAIQTSLGDITPVKTSHCTATPKIEFQAPIPKLSKDPDAYYALCAEFGISREAAECEAVRPHWPGVTALITQRMREGKPLPEGIDPDAVSPMYSVQYRKKPTSEI